MNTPDTEGTLKKSGDEAETLVWYVQHAQTTQDAVDHVGHLLTSRDTYWKERVYKDSIMGMIVKNSTGFDTVGNQRLWHLDIDAFEADLDTLLDNLK